jgi:cytochrome bd-type quinol oxidase subunit 1
VPSGVVIATIAMFFVMYTLLGALYVFLLNDKVQHGPEEAEPRAAPEPGPEPGFPLALRRTVASEKGLAEV